ncbi:hypothetical protein C5167_028159 [Papaver somniferum]|nr:hypothetical protein C5167_028159 [Papaver somniferum]
MMFEAAKNGDGGRHVWKFEDNQKWFCASKLSNEKFHYIHILLDVHNPKSDPISIFIPAGVNFEGWFAISTTLKSITTSSASQKVSAVHQLSPIQTKPNPISSPIKTYAQTVSNNLLAPVKRIVGKHLQGKSPFICDDLADHVNFSANSSKFGAYLNVRESKQQLGNWENAFIISAPSLVHSWEPIGADFCSILQIRSQFTLYPINSTQAIFYAESLLAKENLEFKFTSNNMTVRYLDGGQTF